MIKINNKIVIQQNCYSICKYKFKMCPVKKIFNILLYNVSEYLNVCKKQGTLEKIVCPLGFKF